jgi:glycosyltransferase involved in cell wall biosynthesis
MPKPIRVLHIVGAMNPGGVESWLMALLRYADRAEIAMDFLVHTSQAAAYDAEIAARGGRVIPCPAVHRPSYIREFDRALCGFGSYDVVHSHVHWFSGLTTTLARCRGVGVRIAHSHSDSSVPEAGASPLRAAYRSLMRRGMFTSATHLIAASGPAGRALFGADWSRRPRARVLYCGLDFAPFAAADANRDRESTRREFGIACDEIVLGHVGSFNPPKNHAFLAAIAAAALDRDPRVCVFSVGAGPLSKSLEAQFKQAGVRAIFSGLRSDVPRLLRAMDVFVFPSLYEGLPLAVVEAQAAGLPCVVSTEVTREVDVVPGLIRWLPLSVGAGAWADAVLESAGQRSQAAAGLLAMRSSTFSVEASFKHLRSIYRSG